MADSRPTVLLLTTNLGLGGSQRVVRDHAAALDDHFDVVKAVFNLDGGDFFDGRDDYISLDVAGGGGLLRKLSHFAQRVERTRAIKRERRVAVSISHLEGADYVNLLSRAGDRIILCVHGSKLADRNIAGWMGRLRKTILIPRLYNRADAIVTVSRDIEPELRRLGVTRPPIRTINNFFDVERIRALAEEPLDAGEERLFDATPMLVTMGRLALQKNQAPLLDLVASLKDRHPVRLMLIGDGELRADLVARGKRLGLSICEADRGDTPNPGADVYFMGSKANPFRYLRRAALFLLPSGWEGFPMALGEAMACGAPVIAADCPTGPREFLAPDTRMGEPLRGAEYGPYGVLAPIIDPDDVEATGLPAWRDAVVDLLDDPGKRSTFGEAARGRMEDFRPERIVSQWVELIGGLAKAP